MSKPTMPSPPPADHPAEIDGSVGSVQPCSKYARNRLEGMGRAGQGQLPHSNWRTAPAAGPGLLNLSR